MQSSDEQLCVLLMQSKAEHVYDDTDPGEFAHLTNEQLCALFRSWSQMDPEPGTCAQLIHSTAVAGTELIDTALDMVRDESVGCVCSQGLLLPNECEDYSDRAMDSFSSIPSLIDSNTVVDPENRT